MTFKQQKKDWKVIDNTKEIRSKPHSLRVYYSEQRGQLENLKKSGSQTVDVKKNKWVFFDKLIL